MAQIKVTTTKINRKNLTCMIAAVAVVFDANLSAMIEEEDLKAILAVDPSLDYEGKPEATPETEKSDFEKELDAASPAIEEAVVVSYETPESLAAMKKVSELSPELLGGWTSCMKGKIVRHYGKPAEECSEGINHGNWEKILGCIALALGIADPEVWIPEQIALFTVWSVSCIFGEEEETEEDKIADNSDLNFDDLTKAALQDIAKESGLDAKEWKSLKKADLIDYLNEKI